MKAAAEKISLYGLRKFTMDEIATELKISKKTIYKYFKSKEDIIVEYFNEIIESDKNYTLETIKADRSLIDKLNTVVYSYHKYRLPVAVVDEAHKFYYDEWQKVQDLKNFKLKLIEDILNAAKEDGVLKNDADLHIVSLMLESTSTTFMDYEFLSKNNMTLLGAMESVLGIVLHGILK